MPDVAPPSPDEAFAHADFVRSMARSVLGRDPAVEDAVQETWLVALRRGPRDRASLRAWLGSIARNAALTIRRATSRRAARERIAARAEALPSPERIAEVEDARRRLVHAVLALDEPYRSTVLLRYYSGLSPADIAAAQAVPQETVRTRLQRGLARLRERFAADHSGDRRSAALALLPLAFPHGTPPISFPWAEVLVMKKVAAAVAALLVAALAVGWSVGWIGADASDVMPAGSSESASAAAATPTLAVGPTASTNAASRDGAAHGRGSDRFPLSGTVVDPEGRPILGARVWTARRFTDDMPADAVRSDATGAFTVDGALSESLFADSDGFCMASASSTRGARHTLVLYRQAGRHRVRVLDADGRPVLGALVVVGDWMHRARTVARSNAEGRVEIAGTPPLWGHGIDISAPGFLSTRLDMPPAVAGNAEIVLRLERAGLVDGRVLGREDGAPIAGAFVTIVGDSGHETTTDADGRFRLASDVGQRRAQIRAVAKGHRSEVTIVATRGAATLTLRLERLVECSGRVLAADGTPAAGARVRASAHAAEVTADAEGRVQFEASAPSASRSLVIFARHERLGVGVATLTERVPFEIRLSRAASVSGLVLGADGKPVVGALVHADWRSATHSDAVARSVSSLAGATWGGSIATDAEGRFRVDAMPVGTLSLRAERAGSDRATPVWFGTATLRAGETTEVTLRAASGRVLHGVVIDDAGASMPFVEVTGDGGRTMADADGRFVLHVRSAEPTATTWVSVQAADSSGEIEQVLPDAKDVRVVIRRQRTVRVRLAGHVPPEGTVVQFAVQAAESEEGHSGAAAVSDGEIVFAGVGVDAMKVFVRAPTGVGGPIEVTAAPGTGIAVGTVRLKPATSISGVVVDEWGRGLSGVEVNVGHRGKSSPIALAGWDTVSASDGTFTVDGVPPGTEWGVAASARGFAQPVPRIVSAGAKDVRVELTSIAHIHGRVVTADGDRPIAMRVADRRPEGTSWATVTVDADGRFRFDGVAAGSHLLKVIRGGRDGPEQSVEATATTPEVVLRGPDPGLSIRGQFVDASGAAARFESLTPSLSVMAGSTGAFASVDASGRFEAIGLEPGDYDLVASLHGGHATKTRVPAGTQDVSLRWLLHGAVDGRVVVPAGAAVDRITVALVPADRPSSIVGSTDAAGDRFHIAAAPGRYRLLARAGPFVRVTDEVVEVPEKAVAHASDVELALGGSVEGVVRTPEGALIPRAHVGLIPKGGTVVFEGRADAQGRYRVEGVPAGEYVAAAGRSVDRPAVNVTAGATATLDLVSR